ncbi:hypothetical protein ACA910_016753 [Epithemia clementina (nom. ined.)]
MIATVFDSKEDDICEGGSPSGNHETAGRKRKKGLRVVMESAMLQLESSSQVFANAGAVPPRPVSLQRTMNLTIRDDLYDEFTFLHAFVTQAATRNKFLDDEGKMQRLCPKSTSGWFRTLFILNGRALDWIIFPWLVVTLHAVIYAYIDVYLTDFDQEDATDLWQPIFTFALNTTLGFLLVFRLNRAAERYWQARVFWGQVIIAVRALVSSLLVHGSHARKHRDEALRWLAAFPLTAKDFIRGEIKLHPDGYAGIVSAEELRELEHNTHAPLFVAYQVRRHLKAMYGVSEGTDPALAFSRTQQMIFMEEQLNRMLEAQGSMERIKGTPLPLVYVTHLRSFILINLFLLPWVWGASLGWYTVPIVAVVAFALLGIEASSAEVEIPFRKDRPNALDMDGFCKIILSNILQLLSEYRNDDFNEWKSENSTSNSEYKPKFEPGRISETRETDSYIRES